MKLSNPQLLFLLNGLLANHAYSFTTTNNGRQTSFVVPRAQTTRLFSTEQAEPATTTSFIQTELRGAAMKLHTTAQAPKEGGVKVTEPAEPYVPTHDDYLAFLVDSCHVYEKFEEIVGEMEELSQFRGTGMERTEALKTDIDFMVKEYDLERPSVGTAGIKYAELIQELVEGEDNDSSRIPAFMCHFYNHYFAHTAGGRMIGKQMSALLLEKKTLEFYKWDGDINKIKEAVKEKIEAMAAGWTREEKDACVEQTEAAFRGGGGLNGYLSRGKAAM